MRSRQRPVVRQLGNGRTVPGVSRRRHELVLAPPRQPQRSSQRPTTGGSDVTRWGDKVRVQLAPRGRQLCWKPARPSHTATYKGGRRDLVPSSRGRPSQIGSDCVYMWIREPPWNLGTHSRRRWRQPLLTTSVHQQIRAELPSLPLPLPQPNMQIGFRIISGVRDRASRGGYSRAVRVNFKKS